MPKSLYKVLPNGELAGATVKGASTPMKICIQADLDTTGTLPHMNKNNSERAACRTHPRARTSFLLLLNRTSFLFVFDSEWDMSTVSTGAEIPCCIPV